MRTLNRHHYTKGIFLCSVLVLLFIWPYCVIRNSSPLTILPINQLPPSPPWAYATFLSPCIRCTNASTTLEKEDYRKDPLADPYFTSVRLLSYQVLHASKTRTQLKMPFIVLTLPNTPKVQEDILQSEGAKIVRIEPIDLPQAFSPSSVENTRFRDVLAKLRLWQLTQYEKILFLDGDSILLSRLDNAFTDPQLSAPRDTLKITELEGNELAPPLPSTYLLSASMDTWGSQEEWLNSDQTEYLCACFMLLAPSVELYRYYEWILSRPESLFNASYPDQDLLIYAFRRGGNMPWNKAAIEWSANDGRLMDTPGHTKFGVKSLHVKAWDGAEGGNLATDEVKVMWTKLVSEMNIFYKQTQV